MLLSESHFKQRQDALNEDRESRKKELAHYEKELKSISSTLEELKEQQNDSTEELQEIRRRINDYTRTIEKCNQQILESMDQNAEIKAKLQHYVTLEEQNTLKKAELTQKVLL